jgi:serine/threonine-protein kinase
MSWTCAACRTINGPNDAECLTCGAALDLDEPQEMTGQVPVASYQPADAQAGNQGAHQQALAAAAPQALSPPPAAAPSGHRRVAAVVAVAVIVAALAGFVGATLIGGDEAEDISSSADESDRTGGNIERTDNDDADLPSEQPADEDPDPVATEESDAAPLLATTTTAAPTTIDPTAAAEEQLRIQVAADEGSVSALAGFWVPQVSSKKVGLRADGIVYDNAAILTHYEGLKARFPDALLLWSGNWASFDSPDFVVVVIDRPSSTPDGALGWCYDQGIDRDNCFAKLISDDTSIADTTQLQPA